MVSKERYTLEGYLKFQALFEHSLDAFLLAGDDACYVDANPAACELLGFDRDELLAISVWDLTPELNRDTGQALWEDFLASGKQNGEYVVMRKDGAIRNVEYRAVANILPGLHLSVLRDITKRKQSEAALEREQEVIQKIFNRIPVMIVRYSPDLGQFKVNQEFERIAGWTVEEANQLNLMEVCYPEPDYRDKVRAFMESLKEGWLDLALTTKDGAKVETSWSNIRLSGDTHIGIGIDIRERKRAEESLRKSNEKYRSILASITDAYIALDRDWRFIEINPIAEELIFHKPSHALAGKGIWREYPQEMETLFHQQCRLAVQSGEPKHFEAKFRSVSRWFMVHAYPRTDRLEIYLQDITARKDAEEALLEVNSELGERVRARTQELETLTRTLQDEIVERKQIEDELSELQRYLMDRVETEQMGLARELHDGPMQDLYALEYRIASLLKDGPEYTDDLHMIQEEIKRVNTKLRMVARDLRPPALSEFGLRAGIREHSSRHMQNSKELSLHLDLNVDDRILNDQVSLAFFRIYQVALTNVVRHSHASRAAVRLYRHGANIVLDLEDDGIGFESPENWVELARDGHLGLVGARERAESVGGKLEVHSQPGEGTLIRVTVPLSEKSEQQ